MNEILIALAIGVSAGIIDVLPMLIQKMDKTACLSAFVHYVVLGLIIPFISWQIAPWLKGVIVSELSALPIALIVFPGDKKALIPILSFAAILGAGIAIAGKLFIG